MICSNCKNDVSDDSLYCGKCGQSLIGSDLQVTRNDFTHKLNNTKILNFQNDESFGERYRIISELGKGGMGQVFKAHDSVLDIDVALKMIRPEFLLNEKMISRFKQEILLAREITHENVSRIYDFGEVDGTKFISMEFINGRTLKNIVKTDGPIEVEKAIEISKAICRGLEAAHKKEIIHRDLKPQNIMIDENDHVYITDFGLAKSVREENVSHTGLVIGTPQYIPPELWKGEVADKRSDIYSLGMIMYEMVVGEELFQSESDYGYLQKHVNEEPEFPVNIKEKIPSFYKNLILKCLFKDRVNRYQDCSGIFRDLKDRMYSKGTFISEVERSIKKTGPLKIGLSLLLILVISFIGSLILKKGPPVQKKRSVAILYFKNLSGMKELDHYSYSLPELLATDLGQSKYIRVLPDDKVSEVLKEKNYLSLNVFDQKFFESIGDEANVNYLVQGSFIRSGEDLRITIKLRDSDTGEMLSTDYQDVSIDNIFPAIDRLTTGLKKRFNLTENEIFADIDSDIESITTSSQEALNHYITGKCMFNERKFEESLVEYQKAVDIDPEFAMAYRNMAFSYAHLNDWDNRKKYIEKTIVYVNKLSIREKYLIYGGYYSESENTYHKAIDAFKKIIDIYPYDYDANYYMGQLYRLAEEWDKGIEHLTKALDENKTSIYALSEAVICYQNKGDYQKAEVMIKKYLEENKKANLDRVLLYSYLLKLSQKKLDLASGIVDERNIISKKANSVKKYNKGVIYILQENYEGAEKIVLEQKAHPYSHNYPQLRILKHLYLVQGKFKEYETQIKKEISDESFLGSKNELRYQLSSIYLFSGFNKKLNLELENLTVFENFPTEKIFVMSFKAYYELSIGNLKGSEVLIKKIENLAEVSFFKKLSHRILFHLKALLQEKRGNYKDAEFFFQKSLKSIERLDDRFVTPYFYNSALFYYRQENYEKAEDLLKHIQKLSFGRLYRGDLYAKSFYYMGKIYQKKGWRGKAIESYENFFSIWKDGDPDFVGKYIEDTKEQLRILKNKI